jgi:hypothetical protein
MVIKKPDLNTWYLVKSVVPTKTNLKNNLVYDIWVEHFGPGKHGVRFTDCSFSGKKWYNEDDEEVANVTHWMLAGGPSINVGE